MEIKVLTPSERKYIYSQSSQLKNQTGSIGHLRGDFDSSGTSFFTTWFDHRKQWKTEEFKADLDRVINGLRGKQGLLHGRKEMNAFIAAYPESFLEAESVRNTVFGWIARIMPFCFAAIRPEGDITFTAIAM